MSGEEITKEKLKNFGIVILRIVLIAGGISLLLVGGDKLLSSGHLLLGGLLLILGFACIAVPLYFFLGNHNQ